MAQVSPDGTLSTTVTQTGNAFAIDNGTRVGNNLFHSFSQFSVPTGGAAIFNNAVDVQNIFSRITGGSASTIDGLIQANGSASLFLLNPHGILFGPNAALNIGGSFIGTTANSIQFSDGVEFSANHPGSSPLLTISVPIGLQFGQNPVAIQVQGTGHRLAASSSLIDPYFPYAPYGGLQVQPNRTLALIGGNIDLIGGILQAPGGRIELGSVAQSGAVSLSAIEQGFSTNYAGMTGFGTINLAQQSSIEVRGLTSGNIQVQGGQVNIQDGSLISGTNFGTPVAGTITVSAAQGLTLNGTGPILNVLTGILEDNFGAGSGANIAIQTPTLLIQSGGAIFSRNYGSGPGGTVTLNAENLKIAGYAANAPDVFSRVGTLTTAAGKGGDLFVATQALSIQAGAFMGSTNLLDGSGGGDVVINADTINVQGISPVNISSIIGANNLGRAGQSGNLTVNTRLLFARDGGLLATSSISAGKAGNLLVNASESIEVNGYSNSNSYTSAISSTVSPPPPIYQQLFGLSKVPSGAGGNVTINTPSLVVSNYGTINVSNDGIGRAGTVSIHTGKLLLKDNAFIGALTLSGDGGNIAIQSDQIVMVKNARIGAAAFGRGNIGNGGNISIDASVIVGVNNSDIVANASQGQGGNIQITTQGIFGLKYRDQLTLENDISASSEFGINGTVAINTPGIDPNAGLLPLPVDVVDVSRQIVPTCAPQENSSFVITGRGGIPENPTWQLRASSAWVDLRDRSAYLSPVRQPIHRPSATPAASASAPNRWVEATGWRHNADGTLELIADPAAGITAALPPCGGLQQSQPSHR